MRPQDLIDASASTVCDRPVSSDQSAVQAMCNRLFLSLQAIQLYSYIKYLPILQFDLSIRRELLGVLLRADHNLQHVTVLQACRAQR